MYPHVVENDGEIRPCVEYRFGVGADSLCFSKDEALDGDDGIAAGSLRL